MTASDDVQIKAYADRGCVPADESDIAYVEIAMVDADGNLNTDAAKDVSVSIEGPGVIAGYGSADPASEENYFDTTARRMREDFARQCVVTAKRARLP